MPEQSFPLNEDTSPTRAIHPSNNLWRYLILGGMLIVLLMTVMVTLIVFLSSEDENSPESEIQAPTEQPIIQQNTSIPEVTVIPPTVQTQPTILATAAVDEIAVALLNPIDTPVPGLTIALQADPFTITGSNARTEIVTYTVQSGDTLKGIGARFGIDWCTLVWSNPRNKVSLLRPGVILDVLPVDGVFYTVQDNITIADLALQTGVDPFTIIDTPQNQLVNFAPETVLVEGMKIMIPGGNGGSCNIWASSAGSVVSADAAGVVTSGDLWGCAYNVNNPGVPAMNPLQTGYSFFQGFSGAHQGVDLSAAAGSTVYSAGSGTVAFAGWSEYGYGNVVVIAHGSTFTLYAHLLTMNVSCGQGVSQGTIVGAVGSTGRSQGPHLHFEIWTSGMSAIDPTVMIRF